jgi:hypothetical protein
MEVQYHAVCAMRREELTFASFKFLICNKMCQLTSRDEHVDARIRLCQWRAGGWNTNNQRTVYTTALGRLAFFPLVLTNSEQSGTSTGIHCILAAVFQVNSITIQYYNIYKYYISMFCSEPDGD